MLFYCVVLYSLFCVNCEDLEVAGGTSYYWLTDYHPHQPISTKDNQDPVCEWEELQGRCVKPTRCLNTLAKESAEKPYPACSKEGEPMRICCTDCELVNDTSNAVISPTGGLHWKDGRKARDNCLQYLKDLPNKCTLVGYYGGIGRKLDPERKCYNSTLWAVGGSPPPWYKDPSESPYEALMGFGLEVETALWQTVGTIISDKFILTSAHGHTSTSGKLPLKFAALGVQDRSEDKKNWQIHTVKKVYHHPMYDEGKNRYNDIALVELETSIKFNANILPACLPDPTVDFDIETAKVFVWKDSNMTGDTFLNQSQLVAVARIAADKCADEITKRDDLSPIVFDTFLPKRVDDKTQLCYNGKHENTCLNVIGSPVVIDNPITYCMKTVIGVKAYGEVCGIVVYTKVAAYIDWIESIVWPTE